MIIVAFDLERRLECLRMYIFGAKQPTIDMGAFFLSQSIGHNMCAVNYADSIREK